LVWFFVVVVVFFHKRLQQRLETKEEIYVENWHKITTYLTENYTEILGKA